MTFQNRKLIFDKNLTILRFIFGLSAIEGLIAASLLLRTPSEAGLFLGLSPARLAILSIILLISFFNILIAVKQKFAQTISALLLKHETPAFFTCLSFAGLLLTSLSLLYDLYSATQVYTYFAYAQRLSQLFVYLALLLLQIAIYLVIRNRFNLAEILKSEKGFLLPWFLTLTGLFILACLIIVSRIGLTPDPVGWGTPTVPLMEWQIWFVVLVCVLFRIFADTRVFRRLSDWQKTNPVISSVEISFAIWALAVFVWASQPVPPGFFATPPRAPNFEIYPFSDAAFYDFHAQSLLIGLGYRGESIPPRPLYIAFLAVAHLLAGQNYVSVIFIQTLVLALFPVVVFWIGKKLVSNTVGISAAIFIILREWTSIVSTPFTSDISNTKLLFADLPASLVISIVILAAVDWMQKPGRMINALLTGGILGISLLVRTQIIILLPVLLAGFWITLFVRKYPSKHLLYSSGLFLVGFILAISPWLIRNYGITGKLVFDHPESQSRVMAQRYYPEIEPEDFDPKEGETTADYTRRLSSAIQEKIFSNPANVIQFVTAHWINNEIANLQIFPVRFSIVNFSELIKPSHAFWEKWNGSATPGQTMLMLFNLSVIAAGVVLMVRKNSWAGLLPLLVNLAYHFSNAAARNSGWRYLLPVDWVFLMYFAAGIYALVNLGKRFSEQTSSVDFKPQISLTKFGSVFSLSAVAAGILCLGSTPLVAENAFPKTYQNATVDELEPTILNAVTRQPGVNQETITTALEDPATILMHGRMLYPRFYGENEGEEKTGKTGYAPMPYARYVFLVAGIPEGTVIFPNTISDLPLRNAEDVILLGCMDELAVKAAMVILPGDTPAAFLSDPAPEWICPQVR